MSPDIGTLAGHVVGPFFEHGNAPGEGERRKVSLNQPVELQEMIIKGVVPGDTNDPEALFDLLHARLMLYNPLSLKLSKPAYKRLHLMYGTVCRAQSRSAHCKVTY